MSRHKFVFSPQPLANGASMGCEYCGALNNENKPGCIPSTPEQGTLFTIIIFIKLYIYLL